MTQVMASAARSVAVDPPRLAVDVRATSPIGLRIGAVLTAAGIAVAQNGAGAAAGIVIVTEDLTRLISVGQIRRLIGADDGKCIVIVSPGCGPVAARRALRAGASSVVLEAHLDDTLVPAVRAVAAGMSALPLPLRTAEDRPSLSHREREVLRLAIAGNTNSEIATGMFLAQSTVKSHLSSAYRKIGAGSRKEATSLILDPDEGLLDVVFGARTELAPERCS
jgi:DNA-binding NarL/FixJ family response regulator